MTKKDMIGQKKTFFAILTLIIIASNAMGFSVLQKARANEYVVPPEVKNKVFSLEKKVKVDGEWKDRAENVTPGTVLEFKIEAENVGEVATDHMKIIDELPSELVRIEGPSVWAFDNFRVGDIRTFYYKAKVKESIELDGGRCVVNTASLYWRENKEASDVAVVCVAPKVLPAAGGGNLGMMIMSLGMALTGCALRKLESTKTTDDRRLSW